jgi:radical SAM protein with 4Fe4S-binding SPASM domain
MCSPDGRPDGAELTPDETRAICEQVFPKASLLTPSAGSEPLLGDFELITELCKKYDVQLNVITNGVLLKPEKYEMMRGILGRLQVSFDSHEKETYEEIRVGSKFETVVENIREACKLAAEDHVEVMTSSVIITLNWMKMAEYVDFVADLGVDTVALQQLLINFPALEKWDVAKTVPADDLRREIDRAVETARRRKINLHVGLGRPAVHLFNEKKFRTFKLNYLAEPVIQRYPKVCYHMAIYAKIDPDGSVFPCCRAPKELLMGNVKQQPFDSIWNGKEYRQLRKEFFTDKLRKCCRTCPLLGLYAEGVTVERPENM